MGMLTKEDLGQIGTLLVENNKVLMDGVDGKLEGLKTGLRSEIVASEGRIIEAVGEMIEQNLFPKFDEVDKKLNDVEASIAALPTKEYIDEKLGGMRGEFNLIRRGAGI